MKRIFVPIVFLTVCMISACSFSVTVPSLPAKTEVPQIPTASPTATAAPSPELRPYYNDMIGLSFQYPSNWFGPDEYISEQTLRVEVGSDKVYPYGTGLEERIYEQRNSYYVVIQFSRNDQTQYWKDVHQSLLTLKDGEELSTEGHGLMVRVGELRIGELSGIEYISTLPISAQTEPVYSRHLLLFDGQSNLLSIMGTPNNVDFSIAESWRDAYRIVDEANVEVFHQIAQSVTIKNDSP
jgi:hypothetical protein